MWDSYLACTALFHHLFRPFFATESFLTVESLHLQGSLEILKEGNRIQIWPYRSSLEILKEGNRIQIWPYELNLCVKLRIVTNSCIDYAANISSDAHTQNGWDSPSITPSSRSHTSNSQTTTSNTRQEAEDKKSLLR
ncbi:hypothetical protein TNCV_2937411 [Trichonephila clavipes]|nr:hypothetical protein TNCV_2937411 [Trichonephila clavipes]